MPINYHLQQLTLSDDPGEYIAKALPKGRLNENAIVDRIVSKGSTLRKADIAATLILYTEVIADALLEGYTLKLPTVNSSISFKGVLRDPAEEVDKKSFKIRFSKGKAIRKAEKEVELERVVIPPPTPVIKGVRDKKTGNLNTVMTSGGAIEIKGKRLKIDGDDPACGLWFIAQDGTQTKATDIIENMPARIIAMVPEGLAPGSYRIKVVTQYSQKVLLKKPKSYEYENELVS